MLDHDHYNDLPFCAENKCALNSKIPKLIADLTNKENYMIHYKNLQQCLKYGLKIKKFTEFFILNNHVG